MGNLTRIKDERFLEYLKTRVTKRYIDKMLQLRRVDHCFLTDKEKMLKQSYYIVLSEYNRLKDKNLLPVSDSKLGENLA